MSGTYVVKILQIPSGELRPTPPEGVVYTVYQDGVQYNMFSDGKEEIIKPTLSHVHIQGRYIIRMDNQWVTSSDVNFGTNVENFDLVLGSGATPNIDWDGVGTLIPKGAILKRLLIKGRSNTADVQSLDYYTRVHDTDLESGLPIDTNAEIGATLVSSGTIDLTDGGSKNANDVGVKIISLNDYVMNNNSDFHIMFRNNVGTTLTVDRQYRVSMIIEYITP